MAVNYLKPAPTILTVSEFWLDPENIKGHPKISGVAPDTAHPHPDTGSSTLHESPGPKGRSYLPVGIR